MAWPDRLREGVYIAPDKTEHEFSYEDVRVETEKNTVAYNFPDADGTYVQSLGRSGRRFPMRLFVWGENYDLFATDLENALLLPGIGTLRHPLYGTFSVVPFGKVSRRDNLKTAANQAIIEVEFWESITAIYPTNQDDPGNDVITAVSEFNDSVSTQFVDTVSLSTAVEQSTLKGQYTALVSSVSEGLEAIAATQDDVQKQFEAVRDSINLGIDTLIGEPLTLAFQTAIMIQAPARAATLIDDRLEAYQNLLDSLTTGENAIAVPGFDSENANLFHSKDLYASTYVTGSVLSVINNQFATKSEALTAAEDILTQMDQLIAWRDDNFVSLSAVDTGEAYQQLIEAVGLAAGFLVQISFTLKQERRFITDRARNFIELVAELYGVLDEKYDDFINQNNLSGSEIIEIPAGREIVYYV